MPTSSPNEMSSREMNKINETNHYSYRHKDSENSELLATQRLSQFPLWTALITPLTENNQIDFISLAAIAKTQASFGNGLLLLGSTGEGLALTSKEQLSIVEFVCELKLSVPLMVAVGGYNLADQTDWIRACNQLPIDAYLLSTPIYAKPGPVGQTQWFTCLLDTAKFPCMLYNVPSRSGVEIPVATLMNVQSHPNCWAMKEASGDLNKFLAYRKHCPDIALYSGEDAMMPYLASAGAKGLVSVCANAWPEATLRYVQLSLQSKLESLFPLWQSVVDALFEVANPIPVKILMHQQHAINSAALRAPLTPLELADNITVIEADMQVSKWLASEKLKQETEQYTENLESAVI